MQPIPPPTKSGTFSPASTWCEVGRTIFLIGLAIAGVGLVIMLGVPLFRLPGDFYVKRGNFSFYFPLATSILLSIMLTLLMAFFRR
jgi:hypothetical protein